MTGRPTGTAELLTERASQCASAIVGIANTTNVDAKTVTRLRNQVGTELTGLVVSVAALQKKARQKFGPVEPASGVAEDEVWWVTEKSVEQATPWQVAQLKSVWHGERAVHDLCCGVGGDAVQLARRVSTIAVDSDPLIVAMAALNLSRVTNSNATEVHCDDVTTIDVPRSSSIHIDPDRRVDHARTSSPAYFQPDWSQVLKIVGQSPSSVVKLAPATRIDTFPEIASHRCWISLQRSVREQSLLCGETIAAAGLRPGLRSAVALTADGTATWFSPDVSAEPKIGTAESPSTFLVDPDPAVRAAGLTEAFGNTWNLRTIGEAAGYLTCDDLDQLGPSAKSMSVTGEVIWCGPCDDRKLRTELRQRGCYPSTIKVRGTDHNPAVLTKRYRKCGEEPITLWIGRAANNVYAAITKSI